MTKLQVHNLLDVNIVSSVDEEYDQSSLRKNCIWNDQEYKIVSLKAWLF
jgi:hypothetical protein